jgi:hypothetical protein
MGKKQIKGKHYKTEKNLDDGKCRRNEWGKSGRNRQYSFTVTQQVVQKIAQILYT